MDKVYNNPMNKVLGIIILLAVIISPGLLADTRDQVSAGKAESSQQDMLETEKMDLPSSSAIQASQESAENILVTQSGNTLMTSGTCVVIDAFLREFCNANPEDISCQF